MLSLLEKKGRGITFLAYTLEMAALVRLYLLSSKLL